MVQVLRHYGYSFLFLAVLAENLGLPVPSYPFILVGTALAAELHLRLTGVVAVCALAALLGDEIWFLLGRKQGRPILRKLCSLSLRPDSCVSQTENLFGRHGLKSLLVAKFLPGLNTVAPPLAGMLGVSNLRFALFDLGGIALWAGSAVALGWGFRSQVEWLMAWVAAFGRTSVLILGALLAGWLLFKWVERRRFYRQLARARISPQDLKQRLDRREDLVIVDLRSDLSYQTEVVKIPGALRIAPHEFEERFQEIPPGRPIVMYCT